MEKRKFKMTTYGVVQTCILLCFVCCFVFWMQVFVETENSFGGSLKFTGYQLALGLPVYTKFTTPAGTQWVKFEQPTLIPLISVSFWLLVASFLLEITALVLKIKNISLKSRLILHLISIGFLLFSGITLFFTRQLVADTLGKPSTGFVVVGDIFTASFEIFIAILIGLALIEPRINKGL